MTAPRTVLIIDDCAADRETYRRYLLQDSNYTYTILEEEYGEDGLEVCRRVLPDVILLDFLLPDLDGLEFISELKSQIGEINLPVVMLTGHGNEAIAVAAMKSGVQDYLIKGNTTSESLRLAIHNVVERARLQSLIAQGEERFRTSVETMLDCFGIYTSVRDESGRIVDFLVEYVNAAACANNRMSQAEQIGKHLLKLLPSGWETVLFDKYCSLVETGKPLFEEVLVYSDVYNRQLLTKAFDIRAAKLGDGFVAVWRDTTEQKRTQEALQEQTQQKLREQAALLDVTTDAIFVRDLDNKILFWNKGAEHMYGWQAQEACGKYADILYEEIPPQLKTAFENVTKYGSWQGELSKVSKSGKNVIVASRWALVCNEAGQPKSILTVDTDITEKKQLEAQFLRAQRLESIGTLASGIAHDLNNLLAPILMTAQLLQMKVPDPKSARLLKTLESNAKRGATLVKQVLSFARGLEGKRTFVQVRHLMWEIQQIAKETFPKSIEFYTDIAADLWSILADATQLHQVLMNLVVNARDAMPDGGTLSLSAENLYIDEHYTRMNLDAKAGAYIVITVADTGTGMTPEIMDKIFEPFFTTKELGRGTGLGLSTVIGIIKSHGGFVKVSSSVGEGSQFKVYLPAVEATQNKQAQDIELPDGHEELLLVVDDEASIREITKTALESYNYKVLTASDGIEAIALYVQYKDEISAVLMDMMMPSMDGATTIRTLQKINPQLKIIAVSGLASNEQLAFSAGVGVKAFLSKPYTVKELLHTINAVLIGH